MAELLIVPASWKCEGCGCTDEDACLDAGTSAGVCGWVIASHDGRRVLCSVCARVLVNVSAETRADFQRAEVRHAVLAKLQDLENAAVPVVEIEFDTPETVGEKVRTARALCERFFEDRGTGR